MCKLGRLNEPVGFRVSSLNNLASRQLVPHRKKYKKKTKKEEFSEGIINRCLYKPSYLHLNFCAQFFPSFQRNFRFANAGNEIRR